MAATQIFIFILGNILFAQRGHYGAPITMSKCIQNAQYQDIEAQLLKTKSTKTGLLRQDMLFDDPMGEGGMNSFGKTIVNYVDLDPTNSLLDYNCGSITYNGHQGTDIELLNFYDMDEGVPLLCSAPGVIVYSHDGEFDRQTEWQNDAIANGVIVSLSDGTDAWYWHMRKNSVTVGVGDTVSVGDTLGLVGSSGFSSGPHIHFEVRKDGIFVDPFQGACQQDTSQWLDQGQYVLDLPFDLMDHGLTTIPLSWAMISERPPTKTHVKAPGPIYSWLRLRNVQSTDNLMWKFLFNGSLWDQYGFSPGNTYSSSWWYVWWYLPISSDYYGNWTLEIYRNDSLLAQQNFVYDDLDNQLPTIENMTYYMTNDEQFTGEFAGVDPDGSIFRYEIDSYPANGALTQYGGRKRKFTYIPDEMFAGQDTVVFHAVDDENAEGDNGIYLLNVVDSLAVQVETDIPTDYHLYQNYPNPFNPMTTIRYDLPAATRVTLTIYDILGQEIVTLVSGRQRAGSHKVVWNADRFSSGVYFYSLAIEQNITVSYFKTKKLVVLK